MWLLARHVPPPMPSYDAVPVDGFLQTTVEGALDLAASAEMLR